MEPKYGLSLLLNKQPLLVPGNHLGWVGPIKSTIKLKLIPNAYRCTQLYRDTDER